MLCRSLVAGVAVSFGGILASRAGRVRSVSREPDGKC